LTALDGNLIEAGSRLLVEIAPKALWLCVPQPSSAEDLAARRS